MFIHKYWHLVLLWFVLCLIFLKGIEGLLSFLPINHGGITGFSVMLGPFIVSLGFYLYFTLREKFILYKNVFELLYSCDQSIMVRVKNVSKLDKYIKGRNIPLSLILEIKIGQEEFERFEHSAGYIILKDNLDKLTWYHSKLYIALTNFDDILQSKFPISLMEKFPEQIYAVRLYLLDILKNRFLSGKSLSHEDIPQNTAPNLTGLLKAAINEFHAENDPYKYQRDHKVGEEEIADVTDEDIDALIEMDLEESKAPDLNIGELEKELRELQQKNT